jgi:hypothetical protein
MVLAYETGIGAAFGQVVGVLNFVVTIACAD